MEDAAQILMGIAAQLERATELSNVAEALSGELAKLRGVGHSDDDEATVTVDHQGIVIDVALSEAISDADGRTVSAWVLTATARAIEDVQRQAEPIRAAILQPHLQAPRTDFSQRIDELYDEIQRRDGQSAPGDSGRDGFEEGKR